MFFVYKRVLGALNQCFDKLDQKKIKNGAYLSYLQTFISTESMFHARSTSNIKKNQKKIDFFSVKKLTSLYKK